MASFMEKGFVRTVGAATVLGLGLLWASDDAQADYSYTFTLTPVSSNGANASGTFTLNNIPGTQFSLFTSVNANLYTGGNNYAFNQFFSDSNVRTDRLQPTISATFFNNTASLSFTGIVNINTKEISGSVNTIYSTSPENFYNEASYFDAVLSSGGNSGGGASGAPTPEVNAVVGVLLAGATVAFLRRKRGGRLEATAT